MSYARFIRQRSAAWDEFERVLASLTETRLGHAALENLAFLYRQILHDHAVVSYRYPRTAAAERLRHLALEGTHTLRVETDEHVVGPVRFLTRSFPRAFRRHLPHLVVTVVLFFSAMALGFCMTALRPAVGLTLLGPEKVKGLEEGRLWTESLVSTIPPALSTSAIATNNMSVALTGWAGGALAGIGALHVVLLNGFLLGAVLAATWHYGLAAGLLEFVSAHGPLEITLILVTAAAGLGVGQALVAADDRPRREALAEAGQRAIVVLVGCLPWFVVLGLVEGLISPSPQVPAPLKLGLGLLLEALFLFLAWNPSLEKEEA
jgi:uncharacterized membrane protein SpoIIM required for sporulation